MALKYGIFPGVKTGQTADGLPISDRAVDDQYFARYHSMFLSNGVYGKTSDSFQIIAGDGLVVTLKPGDIFINGWYAYDLGSSTLTVPTPDATTIYRIVAQLDQIDRDIHFEVKAGSNGAAPALERTSDVYELCLAEISLSRGVTKITQSNIRDTRLDTNLCGLVTGVINQVGTDTLLSQMESWFADKKAANEADFKHWYDTFTAQSESNFNTWFAGIKNTLGSDTAGHLLNLINAILDSKGQANGIAGLNSDGVVPLEQGGTGQKSLADTRNAMGLGSSGPVPVSSGGTGVTTPSEIRNLIGLGSSGGPLTVFNGGTGAREAPAALHNLGINWGTWAAPATAAANSFYIQLL